MLHLLANIAVEFILFRNSGLTSSRNSDTDSAIDIFSVQITDIL